MTDEIGIGKTLAERKYIVGVPSPVCGSLYGGAPGCGCCGLVMCTEMDRWSDPPMGAALVTEIAEQSISVATMSMHEKGVPGYR